MKNKRYLSLLILFLNFALLWPLLGMAQNSEFNSLPDPIQNQFLELLETDSPKHSFSQKEEQIIRNWTAKVGLNQKDFSGLLGSSDLSIRSKLFFLKFLNTRISNNSKIQVTTHFASIWSSLRSFEDQWLFLGVARFYLISPDFVSKIQTLVTDYDQPWMLRCEAVKLLSSQQTTESKLVEWIKNEPNPRVRAAIISGTVNFSSNELKLKVFELALGDSWPFVRAQIFESLGPNDPLSELIPKGLSDSSDQVKIAALRAMIRLDSSPYWRLLHLMMEKPKTKDEVLQQILKVAMHFKIREALPLFEKRCRSRNDYQRCSPLLFSKLQHFKASLAAQSSSPQD